MHMADALVSAPVGSTMWAVAAGLVVLSARKLAAKPDDRRVPLMGVLGAFVFAAQMINFAIPGTGSSGHLGGGMILAVLLGPHAAFLSMASILAVQSLFFADGGLLALGCNIFNLGFFPCFVAYPLLYRPLARGGSGRHHAAAVIASMAGLQLGALGVVLETVLSGVSDLPFATFSLMILPIHLAIGLVEGMATAAVVSFVRKAQPELLADEQAGPRRTVLVGFAMAALLVGGLLSWFASSSPDGLEWAIAAASGRQELRAQDTELHATLASVQEKTSVLPDYGFKPDQSEASQPPSPSRAKDESSWPAVNPGTSVSGLVGGLVTLLAAAGIGLLLKRIPHFSRPK